MDLNGRKVVNFFILVEYQNTTTAKLKQSLLEQLRYIPINPHTTYGVAGIKLSTHKTFAHALVVVFSLIKFCQKIICYVI